MHKEEERQTNEDKIKRDADNIDETLEQLDVKLDEVLEKHEKEFLNAYRFHMLKV